jgi:hypothetical protein
MSFRYEAEEIHDFALEPVRRGIRRRDRRVRGVSRIDGRRHVKECPQLGQRPHVVEQEAAGPLPIVAREQRHQPPSQTGGRGVGEHGQRGGVGLQRDLSSPALAES